MMMKRRISSSSSASVSSGPINQNSNNNSVNFPSSSPPDYHNQPQQEQQFCSPPPSTVPSQGTSCPSSPPTPLSSSGCITATTATTTSMTPMNGCEAGPAVRNINHYQAQLQQQHQQSSHVTGSGMPATATSSSSSSSIPSSPPASLSSHCKSFPSQNIAHQNQQSMHHHHHQHQHHQTLYARADTGSNQREQPPPQQSHASMHHVSSSSSSSGVSSSSCTSSAPHAICYACKKVISERFLLKAMDEYWHEDCLKCSCCDCRLGEVGSTLFTKANLILCKRDYLRLFGSTGTCSACQKVIPAFEMVMRARGNTVFHLECFKCQATDCNHRFCVGDEFYMLDNRILCKFDYEEIMSSSKLMFPGANAGNTGANVSGAQVNGSSSTTGAHPANNSSSNSGNPWCSSSLENLRRQTESLKTEIMNT